MNALIGHSGFVGTTLLRQQSFSALFRSTDIANICHQSFDMVVCAGAPAKKWIANREPVMDHNNIQSLMRHLETIRCDTLVLISTVDVFRNPNGVTESSPVEETGLHAYGLHRRMLEKFVARQFPKHLIVRLPGLVGPGLRKNIIFDLQNNNCLDSVDSRSVFQFYPMVNLGFDIQTALRAGLRLLHLTAEPVSVAEVAEHGFGRSFVSELPAPPAEYDFRSQHAAAFGGAGRYQYSKRETIQAIRAYSQSEPKPKSWTAE